MSLAQTAVGLTSASCCLVGRFRPRPCPGCLRSGCSGRRRSQRIERGVGAVLHRLIALVERGGTRCHHALVCRQLDNQAAATSPSMCGTSPATVGRGQLTSTPVPIRPLLMRIMSPALAVFQPLAQKTPGLLRAAFTPLKCRGPGLDWRAKPPSEVAASGSGMPGLAHVLETNSVLIHVVLVSVPSCGR
jgi:hypothetical protein